MTYPTFFTDSLKARANVSAFRRIGSPYAFLSSIGIEPILEAIHKGANVVDIAQELNVPVIVVHRWLEENNYLVEVEKAIKMSADGYLAAGQKLMETAETEFELRKAKELLNHSRWLAANLNKPKYSTAAQNQATPGGVTYVFNIGESKQVAPIEAKPEDYSYLEEAPPVRMMPFDGPEPELGPFVEPPADPATSPLPPHLAPLYAPQAKP